VLEVLESKKVGECLERKKVRKCLERKKMRKCLERKKMRNLCLKLKKAQELLELIWLSCGLRPYFYFWFLSTKTPETHPS
jgi:hypothetical protein